MDEFKQNNLGKETNDSHNTCYQNEIRYKEKQNTFIKNYRCSLFSLFFVIKLGASMTDIFSVVLQKTDKA